MSFYDWLDEEEKKKKKKTVQSTTKTTTNKKKEKETFYDWCDENGYTLPGGESKKESLLDDDIAPVRDDRKWFQKGAFEDGYQFGDLTKTIFGTKEDTERNLWAGILGIGEKLVDAGAMLGTAMNEQNLMQSAQSEMMLNAVTGKKDENVLSRYQQMQDEVEKGTSEFVAKDLYDEAKVANAIVSGKNYSTRKVVGYNPETDSIFGEKSDAVVQSGGQLLAQIGVNTLVPGSGMALMATTAFGSEAESAFQNGATYDEALLSSTISAGAEVLTEKIGGISFGGKTLTDALFSKLSRKMTSKLAKVLITTGKVTTDMTAEGAEELLSGYMSAIGQQLTYMEDKEIEELFSKEDRLESFIGGVVLGGFGGVAEVAKAKSTGVNSVSGLTKNEEAVVNKVYENKLAEREKNGKLSAKEKNKLYDEVVRDMERGYIATDDIESVLGGDSYKTYKDTVDSENSLVEQEKALTKEYNALNKKMWRDMTGEEMDRREELKTLLPELRAKIAENKKSGNSNLLKSKLSQDVFKVVQNDRLVESYNEKVRATQDFEADFAKYKGTKHEDAAKKTLENAIKAGANNSNAVHDIVDMAANLSSETGHIFEFKSNEDIKNDFIELQTKKIEQLEAVENRTAEQNEHLAKLKDQLAKVKSGELVVDGNITGDSIVLNLDSDKPLNSITGHEVTHSLEKAKAYETLRDTIFAYAKTKGVDTDAKIAELKLKYEGVDNANPEAELVADLVGDYLFTDKDFVNKLSTENRNLAQRIYDEIKHLLKMATAGSKEARELERVKYAFENAFREAEQSREANEVGDTDTQYAIREAEPPKETGVAYKVFFVKDGKLYPPMVANPDGADTPMGVWLDADVGKAAPPSKTGRQQVKAGGKGTQGGSGSLAFRPGWHLGDLPRASQFDRVNPETGKKELFPENFVWAEVEYAKDVDYQEEAMSYGYTENGKFRHAYAGLPKLPENGYYRYRTNPKPDTVPWIITGSMKVNRLLSDAEVNQILEQNGVAPVHRQGGDVGLEKFGFEASTNTKPMTAPNEVKYSLSKDTAYMDKAIEKNKSSFFVDENVLAETKAVRERIASKMNEIKNKGLVALPEDVEGNTYIANSSYDGTEENTTICPRSLASEAFVDAVSEYLGRPLTVEEQIYISQDLQGRSLTPECTYCYVATDRKAYRAFLGEYISQRDAVLQKVKDNPNADVSRNGDLYKQFLNGRKDTNPMYNRFKMWVDSYKNGTPMIEASHLANMSKLMGDINSEFGAELKPQIVDAMKYAQSASWAKKRVNYVAYNGHILNWKQDRINKLNSHYGLRMYSFSDFHPAFVLENMQMITDASVRGLKMLGYTKDTDFVEIFAPSGMNINISTFGFETDGNIFENNIIGAEWEKAKALREQYPNVGITFVATNDNLVNWALDQDWIDVVIPYHLVRTGAEVAKAFGYTNYTSESSDTKDVDWKKGTDKKYIAPTEHNNDKATYLEALSKNHLKPRFERFIDNPNYMKLVNECRQPASESKPVQPIFNEEAAMTALAKLEANGYYQPIGGSVDRMYEIAGEVAEAMTKEIAPTQYSLSDSDGNALSAEQQEFFKDSKVRDAKGNLLIMYHGTKAMFTVFDKSKLDDGLGFFFTENKLEATDYGDPMECYLDIKNPFDMFGDTPIEDFLGDAPKYINGSFNYDAAVSGLIDAGYDGIVSYSHGTTWYIPFSPEQIKLTTNKNPTADTDIRYSLSNEGEDFAPIGNFNFYGKDFRKKSADSVAPVVESPVVTDTNVGSNDTEEAPVAPVMEEADSLEAQLYRAEQNLESLDRETETLFRELSEQTISEKEFEERWKDLDRRYAPARQEQERLSKEIADEDNQRFASIDDSDVPPEREAPYYGDEESIVPLDPFADRDMYDVGKRNVKSYMHENPEVKPYFVDAARGMLFDLQNGTKGERWYDENLHYETGGENGWFGTSRHTTEDIAELLDQWHYTYGEIEAGLNEIIEGDAKSAVAKRIEFMLDNRLRNGYNDVYGEPMPRDEGYIDLLKEMRIDEHRKGAFDSFMEVADEYAPPDDWQPLEIGNPIEGDQTALDGFEQDTKGEKPFDKFDKILEIEKAELIAEYETKKADLKNRLADKNAYASNMAKDLYEEIRNLKKGVRASANLGSLLDAGYDWGNLRSALANVRYTPDHTVNQNSVEESAVRQLIAESYADDSYTVDELDAELRTKLSELEKEVAERKKAEKNRVTRKNVYDRIIGDIETGLASSGFDLYDVLDKAHRMNALSINDNTPQRVNDKTFGYEAGEALNDLTFNKVALEEAERTKWVNAQIGTLRKLSKKYGIKPKTKEAAAVQMYAEGFWVNEKDEIIAYGDAELAKDFPDIKVQNRIKALAKDPAIRQIYDTSLSLANEARKRNGYPEIPRIDNYFLHYRAQTDTFSRLGIPFNPNDIKAKDLPTDINGTTVDRKPGQPFFTSAMHREGKRTSFDVFDGLERYINGVSKQIFLIDGIQRTRALWTCIADRYGQAHGLEALDEMELEAQAEHIKKVYNGHLSNYARFLNEYANNLAGKTALIDRGVEGLLGRRFLQFMNSVNTQTGRNQVGYSFSSPLTNFIPSMEVIARTPKQDSIKAFAQTVANVFRKDGFVENDPTLIRRKGADKFSKTLWEKMSDPGYILMGAVDNVTSEFIVRTKYNELTRKGMDSEQAHIKAGEWAMRVMGDRSLGQVPLVYTSKVMGLLTKYQLEVRNALDSQFYDTFQEAKTSTKDIENQKARNAKTAAKIASKTVQIAVLNHIFGQAFEKLAGYNPAFDIVSTIATLFGWDDDEEDEDTLADNFKQAKDELLDDLPYVNIFTDGGRIPVGSALPITEALTGKDKYGNEKPLWKTVAETAPYYLLPGGYGQIKKTFQGGKMFNDDLPISGSYTNSGDLRFPVEETFGNVLQAHLFGQYASKNARDYFDNNRSPLKEKQIQEFIDVDIPIRDYWEYREGLAKQKTNEEKVDYIDSLDLPLSKKNILVNNVLDRKEPVDMEGYDEFSSLDEFDYATKNPGKYAVSQVVGDYSTYTSYKDHINDLEADKDENGKSINGSKKEKVFSYIDSLPIDYGQKCILFKSQYKADDSMNRDILEYLDSREDISYDEMVTILTELGFTVNGNNVYWD